MDHLDKEVIESLSEPAKRMFKSLDYRSKQRMLKKAREMAKAEKMKRRKKRRFKKKGIEKLNKGKKQKKGSSSKSERVLFSIHETRELMVQSMHLMLLGSSVTDASYEERNTEYWQSMKRCSVFFWGWIQKCREQPMKFKIRQKEYSLCWKIISKERNRRVVMKVSCSM